jgi:hypothetical protein
MKCPSITSMAIVPMAILSLALQAPVQAQTDASGSTSSPATGSVPSGQAGGAGQTEQRVAPTAVAAELTKRIDTKTAKQGDEVNVRTTMDAKLSDGTELPKGTKLVGKVMDVKAKTKEDKSSHLAFNLDRAVLKDGKEVPLSVVVISVAVPGQASEVMTQGGGGSGVPGGSPTAGGGSTSSAPAPSAPVMTSSGQSSSGGVLKNAQDRVPVGNMPGAILSASPGAAGTLDAEKDNINLDSRTRLTLSVIPEHSPAGQ